MVKVAPSILSADFADLGQEVKRVDQAGAGLIHLDVMDGHFVPNLTFGVPVIKALRDKTDLPFDVHLMVENPDQYIQPLAAAGADYVTVHAEATVHLHRTIQLLKGHGLKAGVALNPATPLEQLTYVLPMLDLVLIMSVNPGFGGQEFIPATVDKIKCLRQWIVEENLPVIIAVDGGINMDTVGLVTAAGAEIVVAGSAVFGQRDLAAAIADLASAAETTG